MIDEDALNEYAQWIDEAKSKSELIDVLYDIRDDILSDSEDDEDDNGGRAKVLRR